MNYYDSGDLKKYLSQDFYNISWINILNVLEDTICWLVNFHNLNIIHTDIYNGNIWLNHINFFKQAILCDFGIRKSALESNDDERIYGKLSHVVSEVLNAHKYTTASNIYSLGIVMWELMTRRSPFGII